MLFAQRDRAPRSLMCRLFGFRSVIPSQVLTAFTDALFHRVSGVVASETVLAHVRKATQGARTVLNCHPFQYGRWTFAHNGDIPGFDQVRGDLLAEVAPRLRRYVLGDTDSEVVFFVFLSHLAEFGPLSRRHSVEDVSEALRTAMLRVREVACKDESRPLLTAIVSDGDTMVATQGGKELYFSTYKTRCSDRDDCPSLSPECEAPSVTGYVNHLIFSSEPLQGENIWEPLKDGEIIGVDWRTPLSKARSLLGPEVAVQGNLDPAALFAPRAELARARRAVWTQVTLADLLETPLAAAYEGAAARAFLERL